MSQIKVFGVVKCPGTRVRLLRTVVLRRSSPQRVDSINGREKAWGWQGQKTGGESGGGRRLEGTVSDP